MVVFSAEYKVVPSNFTGTIIDDLSNDYCDFTNFVIHYRLCINSGGTNECFENPCGDSKIYPSLCRSLKTNGPVTLEASGIENGTIVSIYCLGFDCEGTFSEVMVFNLQICKLTSREIIFSPSNLECLAGMSFAITTFLAEGVNLKSRKISPASIWD
jgi:hypothetical protein